MESRTQNMTAKSENKNFLNFFEHVGAKIHRITTFQVFKLKFRRNGNRKSRLRKSMIISVNFESEIYYFDFADSTIAFDHSIKSIVSLNKPNTFKYRGNFIMINPLLRRCWLIAAAVTDEGLSNWNVLNRSLSTPPLCFAATEY